jgi:ubiquinone/menaquinone biosynthesis C-methylase UbiE
MTIKKDIAASYGTNPQGFSRYADALVYSHLAQPLATTAKKYGSTFVDVASGTGAVSRLLQGAVAVDLSHGQLSMNSAMQKVQADAESLPFRDHSFHVSVSSFGINHFPSPAGAVREMARVADVVAVSTWVRPERVPHDPKEVVLATIKEHLGRAKSPVGEAVDEMTEKVGSPVAVRALLECAGLRASVWVVAIDVPWPGAERFVEYRLSMMGVDAAKADMKALRTAAIERVSSLPPNALAWRPEVIIGLGRR